MRSFGRAAGAVLALILSVASARAFTLLPDVYVATHGSDDATCGTPQAPCRTLQQGVDRAISGGTVLLVEAGDYQHATITRAVNVQGTKGAGVFKPDGKTCVTVLAPAGSVVSISEFICDQRDALLMGIVFDGGYSLRLSDVVVIIAGACGVGADAPGETTLSMTDSTVKSSHQPPQGVGVCISPKNGTASATLRNVTLQPGLSVGLNSFATGDDKAIVTMADSIVAVDQVGIISSGEGSIVYVRNSTIELNGLGLSPKLSGRIISLGGNALQGNGVNGAFTSIQAAE